LSQHQENSGQTPTLSVVMPVTLRERKNLSLRWRKQPDRSILKRLELALRSYEKRLPLDELGIFLIVAPEHEVDQVSKLVARFTTKPFASVISETELCPGLGYRVPGWYTQQLIKLAAAEHFESSHYLTLDSDIFCVRAFSTSALFADKRALMNVETYEDYSGVYQARFARREWAYKTKRYRASAALLGYQRDTDKYPFFYGETPVVLHRPSVRQLLSHLEKQHHRSWLQTLSEVGTWTEFSLYFQFLEFNGQLLSLHQPVSCNTVLDFEHSIWQASKWYAATRDYDANHFSPDTIQGLFIAVQSWLNEKQWLPSRCRGLNQFYDELARHIRVER
jgi:hypothetical protein